jgi:molecular chaperone GrpE
MSQEDVKASPPSESTDTPPQRQEHTGGTEGPAFETEALRQRLNEAEEQVRANDDRFLRERAELENFKKRMQREKAEAVRFASEPLIRDMLPVVDNLERALEHGAGNGASVLEGVRMVLKSLLDVLERHGVERIDAVGQPFDPERHQAMAQVESLEHEPNQVVQQHHCGYLLHGRLLRPALVTVNCRKIDGTVETEQNSG